MATARIFATSVILTVVGLIGAGWYGGLAGAVSAALLIVLEVSLSFDNAVVNAGILARLTDRWVTLFLTVGVLIAVFGMRILFPILLVSVTAGIGPIEAVQLAMRGGSPETPGTYANVVEAAEPLIGSFGGMFLLMVFLDFMCTDRKLFWLRPIEKVLVLIGRIPSAPAMLAATVLLVASQLVAEEDRTDVLTAGTLGIVVHLAVNGLGPVLEAAQRRGTATAVAGAKVAGTAAFALFVYLQLLDASFSLDGVIGAFAITVDPVLIAIGLGVGAFYVRSLTVLLVRKGTLAEFAYLDHGAHWAIGALAAILLISIERTVPEVISGLIGVGFVGVALLSSISRNRRRAAAGLPADGDAGPEPGRDGDDQREPVTVGVASPAGQPAGPQPRR